MSRVDEARALRPLVEKAAASADFTDAELEVAVALFPEWVVDKEYAVGDKVKYLGTLYRCLTTHTSQDSWAPISAHSLWAQVLTDPSGGILDWVQPDSTNGYMTGDKVRFEGKIYESMIDNNVYSPAAYPAGWREVTE